MACWIGAAQPPQCSPPYAPVFHARFAWGPHACRALGESGPVYLFSLFHPGPQALDRQRFLSMGPHRSWHRLRFCSSSAELLCSWHPLLSQERLNLGHEWMLLLKFLQSLPESSSCPYPPGLWGLVPAAWRIRGRGGLYGTGVGAQSQESVNCQESRNPLEHVPAKQESFPLCLVEPPCLDLSCPTINTRGQTCPCQCVLLGICPRFWHLWLRLCTGSKRSRLFCCLGPCHGIAPGTVPFQGVLPF